MAQVEVPMSDDNKDEGLPEVFTLPSHCVKAARQNMTLRAIAARAGKRLEEFKAILYARPDLAIAIELAYADYEEEKRKRIEQIELDAIAAGELSLQYKINREAIKEMVDRNTVVKVQQVAPEVAFPTAEYAELSPEQLAEIREKTERDDGGSDE